MSVKESTYEELVHPYLQDLKNYCFYLTKSTWDGEDLYQEVLLKCYRYWLGMGHIKEVKPFLIRIARNLWIDINRQRARMQDVPYYYGMDSTDVGYIEVRCAVEQLHERLIQRQLEMWLLAEYFGYSMQDIADQCACSVSAVKSALHRARKSIQTNHSKSQVKVTSDSKAEQCMDRWVRAIMWHRPQELISS